MICKGNFYATIHNSSGTEGIVIQNKTLSRVFSINEKKTRRPNSSRDGFMRVLNHFAVRELTPSPDAMLLPTSTRRTAANQ